MDLSRSLSLEDMDSCLSGTSCDCYYSIFGISALSTYRRYSTTLEHALTRQSRLSSVVLLLIFFGRFLGLGNFLDPWIPQQLLLLNFPMKKIPDKTHSSYLSSIFPEGSFAGAGINNASFGTHGKPHELYVQHSKKEYITLNYADVRLAKSSPCLFPTILTRPSVSLKFADTVTCLNVVDLAVERDGREQLHDSFSIFDSKGSLIQGLSIDKIGLRCFGTVFCRCKPDGKPYMLQNMKRGSEYDRKIALEFVLLAIVSVILEYALIEVHKKANMKSFVRSNQYNCSCSSSQTAIRYPGFTFCLPP